MRESNKFNFLGGAVIPQPDMPREVNAGWVGGGRYDPSTLPPERLLEIMRQNQLQSWVAANGERPNPETVDAWNQQAALALQAAAAQSANPMDPQGRTDFAREAIIRALESPSIPQHPAYMAPRGKK